MQNIEDVDRLIKSWDRLIARLPGKKREVLEALGQRILGDVRQEIGGTGKVQGWQERYIGSYNGYMAVRAKADTYQVTKSGNRYAVGYITNAIENGHDPRPPRGQERANRPGHKPRENVDRVHGLMFYSSVRYRLKHADPAELRQLMVEIVQGLEGNL